MTSGFMRRQISSSSLMYLTPDFQSGNHCNPLCYLLHCRFPTGYEPGVALKDFALIGLPVRLRDSHLSICFYLPAYLSTHPRAFFSTRNARKAIRRRIAGGILSVDTAEEKVILTIAATRKKRKRNRKHHAGRRIAVLGCLGRMSIPPLGPDIWLLH